MKYVFLIGGETPMELLVLSLFLKGAPPGNLAVGVQRTAFLNWKTFTKIWKIFLESDARFVGFNVLLNSGICHTLFLNDGVVSPNVEALKKQYKFDIFNFHDVNDQHTLSMIRSFSPYVIFNHMPQRIRYPLINLPQTGIVNIHPGLLPDYQGMGSCLWPLIEGAPFHGATLHYIDSEDIDAGPIIACGRFPIKAGDSVLSLHIRCRVIAATLAIYAANRFYRKEKVQSRPQSGGTYHKLPRKDSLRLMYQKGHKYVSWEDRGLVTDNKVNQFEVLDESTGWEWRPWVHKEI